MVVKENMERIKNLMKSVIDPTSKFLYRWLLIISLAVVYNIVIIVARSTFTSMHWEYFYVWMTLDYVSDLIYIIDTVIQFQTSRFEQGILVTDISTLHKWFVRSKTCWITIISILPTDLLYIFIGTQSCYVRFNRFLRGGRMFEAWNRIESETTYPNMFRIATLAFKILIAIHWSTCFYYQFSKWSTLGSTNFVFNKDHDDPSTLYDYMACCYWSTMMLLTLVEMPKPTTSVEFIYAIILVLSAVLLVAYIVGDIGNSVSKVSAQRSEFQAKLDAIKRYLKYRKIGKPLESQILSWFDYLKTEGTESFLTSDDSILETLPRSLQIEINSSVHAATLNRVNLFKNCDKGLLNQLVLKLKPIVFGPGDYICRKGDIGREMYILKKGKLAVVGENGQQTFAQLSEGAVFGEISLLNIVGNKNGNRRTANIRSIGYSDLFYLSKEDLWETLKEYPETAQTLLNTGRQMLQKDNLLDLEVAQKALQSGIIPTSDRILLLESKLDIAQTNAARLLGEIISIWSKLKQRLDLLNEELTRAEARKPNAENSPENQ